jgi:hypothetical protein
MEGFNHAMLQDLPSASMPHSQLPATGLPQPCKPSQGPHILFIFTFCFLCYYFAKEFRAIYSLNIHSLGTRPGQEVVWGKAEVLVASRPVLEVMKAQGTGGHNTMGLGPSQLGWGRTRWLRLLGNLAT